MANKAANAKQKKWMQDIVEWSTCNMGLLYGDEYDGAIPQLHHVTGRSSKQNKVHIGHWFILPVPFELHDVSSNHSCNVTHRKKAFTKRFGNQRELFKTMVLNMEEIGFRVPYIDILLAIDETSA